MSSNSKGWLDELPEPDPFNPETSIPYSISTHGHVAIRIYDISGRVVRTLVHAVKPAGTYTVRWDGRTDDGRQVAPGLYLVELRSQQRVATQKLVLSR